MLPATAFATSAPLTQSRRSLSSTTSLVSQSRPQFPRNVSSTRATLTVSTEPIEPLPSIPLASSYGVGGDDVGLPLVYDEAAIEAYWNQRGSAAAIRLAEVTSLFTPWILRVANDSVMGTLEKNSGKRAAEIREILSKLGPTFVKLGQALSVRPDIVGPEAMNELRSLCDAVPCFENEIAFQMMEEELGRSVHDMYEDISPKPIAAASLGQVYKARLKATGDEVAIKVQRPDMLRKVSLDLYCLKRVALFAEKVQKKFTAAQTDYTSLLLEWARGTYKELDYENEAANSKRFAKLVQAKLPDVYVPSVFDDYTSRKVLTMEWVHGKKLADCEPDQINALVSKGVECFLFQLLSAGFFHADPHQANIMRLDSGQLCIIDFGLMAEIEKQEMDAMVSAIVHLANRDWPNVIDDFVALKFLPDDIDKSQVEPVIGAILDQALEGGGAKSINFQSLSDELAAVTFDFPFSIPPAFALLLRALSVLEGIALVGDPEFKLIMESFPFVSKLVMTDRSPALREALRQILYKDGSFSPTRLRVLLDSSQGILNESDAFVDFDSLSQDSVVTRDAIDFLFSEEGALIKDIIVEEVANGIDVLARESYARVAASFESSVPAPLRGFLPMSALSSSSSNPLMRMPFFALPPVNDDERAYLSNLREIIEWLTVDGSKNKALSFDALLPLLPEIMSKSQVLGREVIGKLGETFVRRLFNDFLRGGGETIGGKQRVSIL